jgi:hypothetical protein
MCVSMSGPDGARGFDPTRCPLLQGLSLEEADQMMKTDPRIRACVAAMEAGTPSKEPCVTKMVRAYEKRGTAKVA